MAAAQATRSCSPLRFLPWLLVFTLWVAELMCSWTDLLSDGLDNLLDASRHGTVPNWLASRDVSDPSFAALFANASWDTVRFNASAHDEELFGLFGIHLFPNPQDLMPPEVREKVDQVTQYIAARVHDLFIFLRKLEVYASMLFLIAAKLFLAAFFFKLTGSPRFTAMSWGILTILGFELTFKLAKLHVKAIIFILMSGVLPTFVFLIFWALHELDVIDFGAILRCIGDVFAREMDVTGDGKFDWQDFKDMKKYLRQSVSGSPATRRAPVAAAKQPLLANPEPQTQL